VRRRCLAQLVNVIAPIMTQPVAARGGRPVTTRSLSLPGTGGAWCCSCRCSRLSTKRKRSAMCRCWTRSPSRPTRAGDVVRGQPGPDDAGGAGCGSAVAAVFVRRLPRGPISGGDPDAVSTLSSPDRVVAKMLDDPNLDGGRLQAVLPPLSWNMIRLRSQRPARRCMSFNQCRRRLRAGTYERWPKSRCPAATPPGLC